MTSARVPIDQELDDAATNGPARSIVIPPCPELLVRLQNLMAQDDPDYDALVEIAQADVAMAASLIRTSSSPIYGRTTPTTSVDQAVAILGMRRTEAILTCFLVSNALPVNSALLENFWDHSSQRATAMAHVAKDLPGVDAGLAQTIGLFSHVGIPVMLSSLKGYGATLAEAQARKDRSFSETEQVNHKTDHAIVGALVARAWSLPPALVAVIRLHHDFLIFGSRSVAPEVQTFVAQLAMVEHLLARLQGKKDKDWEAHGAACLNWLNLDDDALTLLGESLDERMRSGAL